MSPASLLRGLPTAAAAGASARTRAQVARSSVEAARAWRWEDGVSTSTKRPAVETPAARARTLCSAAPVAADEEDDAKVSKQPRQSCTHRVARHHLAPLGVVRCNLRLWSCFTGCAQAQAAPEVLARVVVQRERALLVGGSQQQGQRSGGKQQQRAADSSASWVLC